MASNSKAKGPEEATTKAKDTSKGKAIAVQYEILKAPSGGPKTQDIPVLPSNQHPSELTEGKSAKLGTKPEPPKTVASVSPNNISVTSAGGLKLRVSVSPAGKRPHTGHAPCSGTLSPSLRQAPASSLFGSCFGSPTKSSTSPPSKAPALQFPPRKQTPLSPTRRAPSDPPKPAAGGPPTTQPEKKANVQESTSAKPAAELAVATEPPVPGPPISAKSPSCRCDISIAQSDIAGQSLPLETAASAGGPASMSNQENDPSTSSGQQNINPSANELIAAVREAEVKRKAEQPDAVLGPIQGLRPPRRLILVPQRQDYDAGEGDPRPRADPSAPPSSDAGPSSGPTGRHRITLELEPRPLPRNRDRITYEKPLRRPLTPQSPYRDATGISRLFDNILGRSSPSVAAAALPAGRGIQRGRNVDVIMRDAQLLSSSARFVEPSAGEQDIGDDRQLQSARHPTGKNPAGPSSSLDPVHSRRQDAGASSSKQHGEYSGSANLPVYSDSRQNAGASSSRQHGEYSGSANLPVYSSRQDAGASSSRQLGEYSYSDDLLGSTNSSQFHISGNQGKDPMDVSDPYAAEKAELAKRQQERDAQLLASNQTFHLKDPYREAHFRTIPKEPRNRGQLDPSFSPRPGDIIIRARKRAGLRLIDFYYYDDENYLEEGDQILRAKFDYLPPAKKMYLWCRLYVCGADGTFTFLDSNSDKVVEFARAFKDPRGFMGNP